jgi:hypothetical protein
MAWVMQLWYVCMEHLLTFVWICHDSDMEDNGKLKKCFEEAWPQYGFTILCKVKYHLPS